MNNSRFGDFLHFPYPNELEVKDTNDTRMSASYLETDNGERLKTKLNGKRDDFTSPIVNFPFISTNFPATIRHGDYNSQPIRYFTPCAQYSHFLV